MNNNFRIAIGGIRHETNTFSPISTGNDDFRVSRGAGLTRAAERHVGVTLLPAFVASSIPGGLVRKATYTRLKNELLGELAALGPIDGIYLDLHGAMEVEEIGDGEGDLVAAVRALVGNAPLIAVSLDLHGNISPALVGSADILTAYRTAPHRDEEATRRRALTHLVRALRDKLRPIPVLIKVPLLLAGEAAMTVEEPASSLYARLGELERRPGIMDASLLIGCAWTDSAYTCASVIVVAERDRELARGTAAELAEEVWARRRDFGFSVEVAPVDEAIRQAMQAAERPVFLSDSGDNITAGGAGDIPTFIERLLALGATDALVAGLVDGEAVRRCAAAGTGSEVRLSLGGKLDPINGQPLVVTAQVEQLGYASDNQMGQPGTAVVRVAGVRIILTPDRRAFTDRGAIAAAGVDPMRQKIVVVKLGYLFPDLADHAPRSIMALSSGATSLRLAELPYRNLPRPIFPLDPEFTWQP